CIDTLTLPSSDHRRFTDFMNLSGKNFFEDQCKNVGTNVQTMCVAAKNFVSYSSDFSDSVSYAYGELSNILQTEMVNDLTPHPQNVGINTVDLILSFILSMVFMRLAPMATAFIAAGEEAYLVAQEFQTYYKNALQNGADAISQ